jgi:hypothetical protein
MRASVREGTIVVAKVTLIGEKKEVCRGRLKTNEWNHPCKRTGYKNVPW